jgi:PKD repeat protein
MLYSLYLAIILASVYAFVAENSISDIRKDMDEKYDYFLTFPKDGKQTHYDVTRHNTDLPGKITLTYWTQDNKLDIKKVENIKTLKIDVQSMYEDESMKVFKQGFAVMPKLNLDYWLDAGDGVFTVEFNIDSANEMESLTFTEFPVPKEVRVNGAEWWKSNTNYEVNGKEITISEIPTGKTTVVLYFKLANKLPTADFTISPSKFAGVNEELTFDGSKSTDPDGDIASWVWDFGDEYSDSGETVKHSYPEPGEYTVRLTVRDDAEDFGEDWTEKTVTVSFGAEDDFDGDGLRDKWEWDNFKTLDHDKDDDPDKDGYPNGLELLADTDPTDSEDFKNDSDTDNLPDKWEWDNFQDLDENGYGDPDSDEATNLEEYEAGTDPNIYDKPKEEESKEEPDNMGLMLGVIVAIVVVVIVLVLMFVLKSKKSKEPDVDEEAIAEMEAKIERARKLGLPTGEMEKLLRQAKEGKPLEVQPVRERKGPAKDRAGRKKRR